MQQKQQINTIAHDRSEHLELSYLQYLPPQYGSDPGKKWPLILFLHGAGERGSDLNLIKKHGIARVVEERDLPFITLSPQCPPDHWWSDFLPLLTGMIDRAVQTLNADPNRVYLTGMSMGGYGTWHLAVENPQRFAAIAPICGGAPWMYGVHQKVEKIRRVPTWVFHGAMDDVVPLRESSRMVDLLTELGAEVKFTVYPEAKHDSWTETYNNPALYEWFLSHRMDKEA